MSSLWPKRCGARASRTFNKRQFSTEVDIDTGNRQTDIQQTEEQLDRQTDRQSSRVGFEIVIQLLR